MQIDSDLINGLAGLAALINSCLMWPTIKSIKAIAASLSKSVDDHGKRIEKLEKR